MNETSEKTQHTPKVEARQGNFAGDWLLVDSESSLVVGVAHRVLEIGQPSLIAPAEANARLWAAAPNLYSAAESVEELLRSTWAEGGPNTNAYATALLRLQAAIAPVRGES